MSAKTYTVIVSAQAGATRFDVEAEVRATGPENAIVAALEEAALYLEDRSRVPVTK